MNSLKKIIGVALLFCLVNTLIASEGNVISNADRSDIRYIKNTKRLPDVAYQQELRERSAWKNFVSANGIWYVIFNEENAKPHRAFGKPIPVFGMDAQAKALNFITSKLNGFNIPLNELHYTGSGISENYQYVHYHQVHNELKVLNSDVFVKLTSSGSVVTFGCDVYNDIKVSATPSISATDAIQFAKTEISDKITNTSVNNQLFILPIPEFKQNIYKLVYEVTVSTIDNTNVPARYKVLVNAEDGKIISRKNEILHYTPPPVANTDVVISANVYPTNPYDPIAVRPLRNLKMIEGGTTYNTDSTGFIGLTNTTSTSVNFSLEGYWSHVYTGTNTPVFSTTVNPGTNNLSFNSNANIRELSAYYHVNVIHDYMKTKFPSFTGMDFSLPTKVDITGTCNAFYDGTSINFYAQGGGCNSMAQVGDVVYHEYGHGINDKFYQSQGASFDNGAMGEGYADIWALGVTGSPILGIGMDDADSTVFVRRYDIDKKVYPQDIVGEVHADGEIIAGAWWDTHLNMGNLQQMMDLYKETFYAVVTGPDGTEGQVYVDVLIEALTDDDVPTNGGDNDITNGTPNDNLIVDAFDLHGITLLSNASVIHTPVEASAANNNIIIDATVNITFPWALTAAKTYYKINRTGSWTVINMTNTGGTDYSVSIPAQPEGTVIAYYIGLENTNGTLSAVQPIAADLSVPNVPYFIINGAYLLSKEDFDDNFGGWGLGVIDDDASTGQWIVDVPVGSFSSPADPSTIVQTDNQHTVDGQYCALTGNASGTSSPIGDNDVDDGKTTLESPVYDLTTYTNPIFTYYRWYINNPPSGANPGNDSWEVLISNDGTNWIPVERTNVSDKSWRRVAFRVKDYITLSSTVQMRFVAEDSLIIGTNLDGGSIVEASIDDLYLYEEGSVGIDEKESFESVRVFPNPVNDFVVVSYELMNNDDVTIELLNNVGQVVFTKTSNNLNVGSHYLKINTHELAAGIYMLALKNKKQNHIQKITVVK